MTLVETGSVWYNELGSEMILNIDGSGGLTGTYDSKVGDATEKYVLTGRYDPVQSPPTIGWVVQWVNQYKKVNSVTAWSGQVMSIDGVTTILTTWLLTQQTTPQDEWESTLIDQDVFTQNKPTTEQIQNAKKRRAASHAT